MKYLIVGLGNIGVDYEHTRHNVGFDVVDVLVSSLNGSFSAGKKVNIAEIKFKGKSLIVIKPTTFMNLSGEALRYWMQAEKIKIENVLVVYDDLALPFQTLRLRPGGGAAGHNGITNIIECLNTEQFPRLRIGIGNDFLKGKQVNYVLGKWTDQESEQLVLVKDKAVEVIKSFVLIGLSSTMNQFNKK